MPPIVTTPATPARGPGRRRLADEPADHAVRIRLAASEHRALMAAAAARNQSASEVVRSALAVLLPSADARPRPGLDPGLRAVAADLGRIGGLLRLAIGLREASPLDRAQIRGALVETIAAIKAARHAITNPPA